MKTYLVGIQLFGYERVEVEAKNKKEAFKLAKLESNYRCDEFQHVLDDIQIVT